MYNLLNISILYLLLGSLSVFVYFNIPEDLNTNSISRWILLLAAIYFFLGLSRLRKHYKGKK
tara:strand:+ start:418 stop:603 length:186 start_codon:yes stop_codon:yes gene_type:complete